MSPRTWQVLDADRAVLWREYPFAKGAYATTLVFRGADGLVAISPASRLKAADYDALAPHGEVRALVANNALHHLGQAGWRERFPAAKSYAAPAVLAKLGKKSPAVPFASIDQLELPAGVRAHVLRGCNNGEIFFTIDSARGSVWYTGDILTNIQRTPGPPISWLFRWTDSAPGFRLFRLAIWLVAKDKRALQGQLLALLDEHPPAIIVSAHGPAFEAPDLAEQARAQIARL
jgi:hypothetical protein